MTYIFPITLPNQKLVVAASIVFSILPVTAVALRIAARRIANRKLEPSDYLIVAACVRISRFPSQEDWCANAILDCRSGIPRCCTLRHVNLARKICESRIINLGIAVIVGGLGYHYEDAVKMGGNESFVTLMKVRRPFRQ